MRSRSARTCSSPRHRDRPGRDRPRRPRQLHTSHMRRAGRPAQLLQCGWEAAMPGNRAVVYQGPGQVQVHDIDYPTYEMKDGPGVNKANVGRQDATRRDPQDGRQQHLRQRPAHGARAYHRAGGTGARARDHRRGDRRRAGRRVHQGRRHLLGAVQHLLRPVPQLQGTQDRGLPQRQPGPAGLGVRLRRHGRLGRRSGRVRAGPVRGLEPAEIPGPGPGAWRRSSTWPCSPTSSRPATTAVSARASPPGRRSTSPARARSGWPRPPRRSCSVPRS